LNLLVGHRKRDEADALGLLTADRLAQQQMVLGFGHAAQERPDDCGMITGGNAELGVAIDQTRGFRRDGNIGEDRQHQPAPTAAPLIADTTGLLQLMRL
jgi:hypothetical protein